MSSSVIHAHSGPVACYLPGERGKVIVTGTLKQLELEAIG
jgi:hypothetical protein